MRMTKNRWKTKEGFSVRWLRRGVWKQQQEGTKRSMSARATGGTRRRRRSSCADEDVVVFGCNVRGIERTIDE